MYLRDTLRLPAKGMPKAHRPPSHPFFIGLLGRKQLSKYGLLGVKPVLGLEKYD